MHDLSFICAPCLFVLVTNILIVHYTYHAINHVHHKFLCRIGMFMGTMGTACALERFRLRVRFVFLNHFCVRCELQKCIVSHARWLLYECTTLCLGEGFECIIIIEDFDCFTDCFYFLSTSLLACSLLLFHGCTLFLHCCLELLCVLELLLSIL